DMIRKNVTKSLNNYLDYPTLKDMTNFIVPASLGDNTGVKGSRALALETFNISQAYYSSRNYSYFIYTLLLISF
ncbi:hypothetical protein NAI61_09245, partial [Francisella tularensis subsp. holarctica]|nr:hypothetical protein [Francisella tularensis subsp. holarctica]